MPSDPVAEDEIAALPELPPTPVVTPAPAVSIDLDPLAGIVAGGVALVLELIGTEPDDEPLPRAIARERPRTARPAEDGDPEPPTEPRILK